jgi:hypothetical protein
MHIAHKAIATGIIPRPSFVLDDIPSSTGGISCAGSISVVKADRAGDGGVAGSTMLALGNDAGGAEGWADLVFGVLRTRFDIMDVALSARVRIRSTLKRGLMVVWFCLNEIVRCSKVW